MKTINELVDNDATTIALTPLKWEKLRGKTVLISGATGYVPQFIVHGILKRNDLFNDEIKIIALCRNQDKAAMRFSQYYNRVDFELIIQDICEPVDYDGKIDYIIHAASPAGVIKSNDNPVMTFDVNVIGSKNLLELAQKKCADFLFVSSVDIYGKNSDGMRFTEDYSGALDSLNIRNVYACSKRAAENLCICYSSQGVRVKIVRPSQIMAGGIDLNDGRLHIDFISQIKKRKKIVLKGDGTPLRTFIYITDAIAGILTVMLEGEPSQAYNICSEEGEATVLQFAQVMASCVEEDSVEISYNMSTRTTDPSVKHAISVVTASSEKLRRLGWKPTVSLKDACHKMMRYYGVVE